MGLWDVFTGASAEEAAAQNKKLYQQYQTQGLSDLGSGFAGALPAVQGATAAYAPVTALGQKYGAGSNLYMDALGINGPEGNTRATGAFQASPGYQWGVDQATDQATRKANAFGGLGGNTLDAITRLSSNLANQDYGNWLTRLGGFVPQESQATATGAAGTAAGLGAEAGLYSTDAQNKVNLRGNVAGGIANSNTAAAKAQMDASGQFWNSLMSLGGNAAKGYASNPAGVDAGISSAFSSLGSLFML